jgi:hypothetical protein
VNSVKTLAAALAGTLLVTGLAAAASPASAAGAASATVSARDGVRYDRCHQYQYRYAVDTGEYDSWDAETTFWGPGGRKVGTDYLTGVRGEMSTSSELMCSNDPVGRYKIVLAVTFYDDQGNKAGSAQGVDRFRLRKPHTRTSATVSDRTPRWHQFLTFRVVTKIEGPNGYVPNRYELVALEARRPGGWERIPGSRYRANGRGVAKLKARWERRSPLAIRATTLGERVFDKSVSNAKTLG